MKTKNTYYMLLSFLTLIVVVYLTHGTTITPKSRVQ